MTVPAKKSVLLRKKVGARIRELRKAQKVSQEQLAFEAGIRREALTRLELGQENSTLDTLHGIALALGVDLKELFDFKD